ncbi:hypothetical protein [Kineothrix sedimenti]|uniref:Uncharacterized protein n=1 Tax=Kineothrix sedimenti TaxID=3123317 RepID=A0ABZ3F0C6_9FIRM
MCGERITRLSNVEKVLIYLGDKKILEKELETINEKIEIAANEITDAEIEKLDYDVANNLYREIKYKLNDVKQSSFDTILASKKLKRYPEMSKPTYYPEIDLLDISDEEKLRLDKSARDSVRYYIYEDNVDKFELSVEDLNLLVSIGVAEKKYDFCCEECGNSSLILTEKDVNTYKRIWDLEEKRDLLITEETELDDLLNKYSYGVISLYCMDDDDFFVEICSYEQLNAYKQHIRSLYKISKQPDLSYEKL